MTLESICKFLPYHGEQLLIRWGTLYLKRGRHGRLHAEISEEGLREIAESICDFLLKQEDVDNCKAEIIVRTFFESLSNEEKRENRKELAITKALETIDTMFQQPQR